MNDQGKRAGLGATEVRKAVLTTRRGGYDQEAVDRFLDEVADQLELPVADRTMTARDVTGQAFGSSSLRQGYTEQEVDDLLDAVVDRLRTDEVAATAQAVARDPSASARPATPPRLPEPDHAAPEPVPSPISTPPESSWLSRFTRRRRRGGG